MSNEDGRLFQNDNDPQFHLVVKRLRQGKNDISDVRKKHACSGVMCNPQSEIQMINQGTLTGAAISNNVYLCRYSVIHVCSESSCTLYMANALQTCPVSGFQLGTMVSSYDKNDYRTWEKGKETETNVKRERDEECNVKKEEQKPQPKRYRPLILEKTAKEMASDIVIKLLYSNCRSERNKAAIQEFEKQSIMARNTYVQQRAAIRQLPYLTDIYRLIAHFTSQILPLVEFETDPYLVEYYSCVIYQIWLLIVKYHIPQKEKQFTEVGEEILPRIDFGTVCFGVLYGMRQGITIEGTELLPRDDFLLCNLPMISELAYFDIKKKNKITRGNALLVQMYQNAIRDGAIPQDLILDITKLPERNKPSEYKKLKKDIVIKPKKEFI